MEYHWYEDAEVLAGMVVMNPAREGEDIFIGHLETATALREGREMIRTDQSTFFSTETIANGYRLFAHFADRGGSVEVRIGTVNQSTGREIRRGHNLERLLLAGEFGALHEQGDNG